jgi:hypothetical protein
VEWAPLNQTVLRNMPIQAGETIYTAIWETSVTTASGYMIDENTGQYVTLNFSAPAGTKLSGNSAEWITERPSTSGVLATLADYTYEFMTYGYADAIGGAFAAPGYAPYGTTQYTISMVDSNNQVNSTATLLGLNTLDTKAVGSGY